MVRKKKSESKPKTHRVFKFLNQNAGRDILNKNKMRAAKNVLKTNAELSKNLNKDGFSNARVIGEHILMSAMAIAKRAKRNTVTMEDLNLAREIHGHGGQDTIFALEARLKKGAK